jgi:nucleoid DNA-binding protein
MGYVLRPTRLPLGNSSRENPGDLSKRLVGRPRRLEAVTKFLDGTAVKRLDTKFNLALQLRHTRHCSRDGLPVRLHLSRENRIVTKKEIVKSISEEIGLTQLKTKEIVQKTFDAIIETLVADHRIELRNFGVFEVKKRAARKARNPRTGERVDVAEKWVVTFKPGKEMEERVRQLEQEAADSAARAAAGSAPAPEPVHHG